MSLHGETTPFPLIPPRMRAGSHQPIPIPCPPHQKKKVVIFIIIIIIIIIIISHSSASLL